MAEIIYKNSKINSFRAVKSFLPKNFKEGTTKEQQAVLLNTIELYNRRRKITKLFEHKNIKPSDYPHNAKPEPDEHDRVKEFKPKKADGVEKSEQKSVESVAERVKKRRKKYDE